MLILILQDSSEEFFQRFSAENAIQFSGALRKSISLYRNEFYSRHIKASQFVLDKLSDLNRGHGIKGPSQHSYARKRFQKDAISQGHKFLDHTLRLYILLEEGVYVISPDDISCEITSEEAAYLWPKLVYRKNYVIEHGLI